MIRVIIESPYGGAFRDKNVEYLRAALRDSLMRGEAPYASHGLYTQEGVLDDNTPAERRLGIDAGFEWREAAHRTVVYTDLGISDGMKEGIADAKHKRRDVEYRQLPGWGEDI